MTSLTKYSEVGHKKYHIYHVNEMNWQTWKYFFLYLECKLQKSFENGRVLNKENNYQDQNKLFYV